MHTNVFMNALMHKHRQHFRVEKKEMPELPNISFRKNF